MNAINLHATKHFYEFGPFRIDVTDRLLFRTGSAVPLTPKAFDTLVVLVESAGRILEKDDLMKRVWPDTVVEENNLTQNISALRKALGQSVEEKPYIETLPRRGYRFVAAVRERWEDIPELIVREHTKSTVIVEEEEETQTQTKVLGNLTMPQLAASILALVIGVGSVGYYVHNRRSTAEEGNLSVATTALRRRPAVAVLGLRNLTGRADAAWLSTALSEMLTSELGAGAQLRTIPGENIARMKLDLPLGTSDSLAPDTLSRIRSDLGTDYVVLGSFTDLGAEGGGRIRLDLRLQDARQGTTLAFAGTGTESGLFDLVSQVGTKLRDAIGVGDVPQSEAAEVRAELPSSPATARFYADGLADLRVFRLQLARAALEKAVAADPQFPLAHSALASALSGLGYDAEAEREAKKAFDLSGSLNREERLVIEGRYRAISNQWDQGLEVYQTLFGLFPDNLDYGITLTTCESMAGKGTQVQATLAELRQLPPPEGQDARIDLAEANWAESVSDFKREELSAGRSLARAQSLGEKQLAAQAQLDEGTAQWKLGQPEQALNTLKEAQDTFESEGDRGTVAEALEVTAGVLRDQGNLGGARQKYEQALQIRRATGDEGGVAASLNEIALLNWQQGDLDGAKKMYDQALASFREVGDQNGVGNALNNEANILYDQGELGAALRMYEASSARFTEIGDKGGETLGLLNIGLVLANQGDLAGARSRYQKAADLAGELGTRSQRATALSGLGDVAYMEGDLAEAGRKYAEALNIRREIGEQGAAAEAVVSLALVSVEEGHAEQAMSTLPAAIEEARREGQPVDEAAGYVALARAHLALHNVSEAVKAAAAARSLAAKSQSRPAQLDAQIVAARAAAASGGVGGVREAARALSAVRAEAQKLGFADRALEAALALGTAEVESGDRSGGRALLAQVEKSASEKGFALISHKANEAAK
jgi:DNA-binding winged helix-turn-helix (wHTH) protein/tetratricopeptide (TPR) repeat protein/TolB-like protein